MGAFQDGASASGSFWNEISVSPRLLHPRNHRQMHTDSAWIPLASVAAGIGLVHICFHNNFFMLLSLSAPLRQPHVGWMQKFGFTPPDDEDLEMADTGPAYPAPANSGLPPISVLASGQAPALHILPQASHTGEAPARASGLAAGTAHGASVNAWQGMAMDLAMLGVAAAATLEFMAASRGVGTQLSLLGVYALALLLISHHLHLYTWTRETDLLREQWASAQASLLAGLLWTSSLYLTGQLALPRTAVVTTILLATGLLGVRRLASRVRLERNFRRGVGVRTVLVVGPADTAQRLRREFARNPQSGYSVADTIEVSAQNTAPLSLCIAHARRLFIDEIFLTSACDPHQMQTLMEEAHRYGIRLRMVFSASEETLWHRPLEYVGRYPSVRVHCGQVPWLGLVVKRWTDIAISLLALVSLSPLLALIALAIRLDSPGPVLYASERLGKKGKSFRCFKFRTMIVDAEKQLAALRARNERNGILFKMSHDPRTTRLGRFLRKFSLDELPQFFNVLRGEMSVVGPRPPLAQEVRQYELEHLRRLDVTPGITGLWQVEGRQDPSFESYVALDLAYIDDWSLLLDLKIILRTVFVMLAGTGS